MGFDGLHCARLVYLATEYVGREQATLFVPLSASRLGLYPTMTASKSRKATGPLHPHLALPWSLYKQKKHYDELDRGQLVVISINHSLCFQSLKDPTLQLAAEAMPRKRYLALLLDKEVRHLARDPIYGVELLLVNQGLPKFDDEAGIDPSLSVPILPATNHPERRPGVAPIPEFPLADRHVYMTEAHYCRIGEVQGRNTITPTIFADDCSYALL